MKVYYNEFNPESGAMLRQMMQDGLIPHGDVDERSITEVLPDDLRNYTQCHFFAGIGGWSIALGLAGWPEDRPVWTGSCPCQPFSSAGRQKGKTDDRHLWPVWQRLIIQSKPPVLFGEQVASAIAHGWLDDVYQGLEPEGYAIGAAVLPACSVGAPHKRDRLWFVAHTQSERVCGTSGTSGEATGRSSTGNGVQLSGTGQQCGDVANAESTGSSSLWQGPIQRQFAAENNWACDTSHCTNCGTWWEYCNCSNPNFEIKHVDNAEQPRLERQPRHDGAAEGRQEQERSVTEAGILANVPDIGCEWRQDAAGQDGRHGTEPDNGIPWDTGTWVDCPDGKQRLVEPGIPLLVNGFQHRRPILHAIGNAIVPQVAAEFIRAAM